MRKAVPCLVFAVFALGLAGCTVSIEYEVKSADAEPITIWYQNAVDINTVTASGSWTSSFNSFLPQLAFIQAVKNAGAPFDVSIKSGGEVIRTEAGVSPPATVELSHIFDTWRW
jgi:hypothetical protein